MEERTQVEKCRDDALMSLLSLKQLIFLGASEEEFAEQAAEVEEKIYELYNSVYME